MARIEELHSHAIGEAIHEDGHSGVVTAVISICEFVGEDGESYITTVGDDELPTWRAMGMIHAVALDLDQSWIHNARRR